jgi:hypothetical protein
MVFINAGVWLGSVGIASAVTSCSCKPMRPSQECSQLKKAAQHDTACTATCPTAAQLLGLPGYTAKIHRNSSSC